MKKLTLIILTATIFNFQATAQTKEETISWVKEKLVKYLQVGVNAKSVSIESLDECFIILKMGMDDNATFISYKIPTKDAYIDRGWIKSNNESIFVAERKGYTNYVIPGHAFFAFGEDNIEDRMNLALKKLSSFCPVKKEAF